MARQYKRVYELTITSVDGDVRIIKDLRVNFEITKSVLSYPNLCRLTIYNPNSDTLSALQNIYTKISINAGYEGNVRLLFTGEVRNVFQSKSGTDRTIVVYAGDGEKDWQNSIFNKTFSESMSVGAAIKEVMKSFSSLTIGVTEGLPEVADKLRGQTLSGASKDILDNFADEYGFTWSIQDGEIITTPIESPLQGDEAVVISALTGMINSPTITQTRTDTGTVVEVQVTTSLNPSLLPNRSFKIESVNADVQLGDLFFRKLKITNAEGTYKIIEVIFRGDSRDGEWTSTVKGRALNV